MAIEPDTGLKTIPVVILTTSQAEEDLVRAYQPSANCYVRKPVDFEQCADGVAPPCPLFPPILPRILPRTLRRALK